MTQPVSNQRLPLMALVRERADELRPDLTNWISVGLAAAFAFPSRIPPRAGLFGQRGGRIQVALNLRNGYKLHCRLDELEGYYAAFVHRDYDAAASDWAGVRSILDIGANVGAATLWFARAAPEARIVSVEPNPDVFSRLVANIARSGLGARVTTVAAALGSSSGLASVIPHSWSVATTTVSGVTGEATVVGRFTLEDLLNLLDIDRLDVLKLDCEGAEYGTLLTSPPEVLDRINSIVVECHPVADHNAAELAERLHIAGFAVTGGLKPDQLCVLTAVRPRG